MLKEIADLGFTHVELSHGIRVTLVPGIIKAAEEGFIKISTMHNFCPLPTGVMHAAPNHFEPSSPNSQERAQWVRYTLKSLDFASQMNARLLVLHLGSVRFFWNNPELKLSKFKEKHSDIDFPQSLSYRQLLQKCLLRLQKKTHRFYNYMLDSLNQVIPYAQTKGIDLGLENREGFNEIPQDSIFPELLSALPQPNTCGTWHDTGHGKLKELMGILPQHELLEKSAPFLKGFHLHDVDKGGNDHRPIGDGIIDFEMISSYWCPHHLLTLELSPRTRTQDVSRSKERIEMLLSKLPD